MLIKATHQFAKAIRDNCGPCLSYCVEDVRCVTLTPDQYTLAGGDVYDATDHGYNRRGEHVFKMIKVTYKPDEYAAPRYYTTRDLNGIYGGSDKTYDGFFRAVIREFEI